MVGEVVIISGRFYLSSAINTTETEFGRVGGTRTAVSSVPLYNRFVIK